MANTNLLYDSSSSSGDLKIKRFNDDKCAIVSIELKFNSTGNISKISDEDLLSKAKQMFSINITNIELTQ